MLTRKQYDLLMFIHKRVQRDGVSPSFDEMKEALDLRSKSGIHRLITALEERGFIRRLAHRARAVEIIRLPENVEDTRPNRGFHPSVIEGDLAREDSFARTSAQLGMEPIRRDNDPPPNAKELPENLQESSERAVTRGLDFLKQVPGPTAHPNFKNADELILLACLHGGMSEEDPFFKKLLDRTLAAPLIRTYKAALQAMVLEEIDRVTYQLRIAECCQFLVDNQCTNGQWSYGKFPGPGSC